MAIHPAVALVKRWIRLYGKLQRWTMAKEPIALVHTVLTCISSILITIGVSLPFWVNFKYESKGCEATGYSGIWVACAKHCTKPFPTNADPNPDLHCSDEELCFNFQDSDIASTVLLQVTRALSCVSAFCSFVSVGFAIVRVLRWGLLARPLFNWVLVTISAVSGLAGILVFVLFLTSAINQPEDKTSSNVEHIQPASIVFLVGSALSFIDASFLALGPKCIDSGEVNFGADPDPAAQVGPSHAHDDDE